ncbi:MAG: hypothetical protein QXU20_01630 [Candidatus Woesearchaeota archaeon]
MKEDKKEYYNRIILQNKISIVDYIFKIPNEINFVSKVPVVKKPNNNSFQYYALVNGEQALPNKFVQEYDNQLVNNKEIIREIFLDYEGKNKIITQNKLPKLNLESITKEEKILKNLEVIILKILNYTILNLDKEIVGIINKNLEENGLEERVDSVGYYFKDNKINFVFLRELPDFTIKHDYSLILEGKMLIKKTFFKNKSRYDFMNKNF